ncbi:MAG TPA: hypothetical protein VHY79_15190 [Rhizomicrobium sp.]|jgi:hypothetical protein|nr:hypothetical protein [Rhizomicrobium sp.]
MDSATVWQERQDDAGAVSPRFRRALGILAGLGARSARWPLAALCACAALLALPACIAPMPAMPDYPAHLASFYLLAGGAKLPLLAHVYRVRWAFVPNLAAEAIVPFLAPVLGLSGATALFLAVAVLLWVLGAGAVQWALYRRIGIAPLFASVFAYNANLMWGFINYYFAMGLALCVFAGWIATERKRKALQIACFATAVLVVYFCHVFAAAVLLLLIGCYEIGAAGRPVSLSRIAPRLVPLAAMSVPAILAYVFLKPAGERGLVEFNLLDTWDDRLSAAVQFCFDRPAWVLLAALAGLFGVALWRKKLIVHPRMRFLLAVLVIVCAMVPEWAMGGWGIDLRLPAVLGALAFASAEFSFGPRTAKALALGMVAIIAYCAATLAGNWLYYDHRFAEFRSASRILPAGSKIVTVLDGDALGLASDQPYWHMAEYAIIDRQAFTPLLFTTAGQHVIRLQPAVEHIAARSAQAGSPPDISELDDLAAGNVNDDPDIRKVFPYLIRFQCSFDMALVVHLGGHRSPVPDMLKLEHAGSFFSLYNIRRDGNCTNK